MVDNQGGSHFYEDFPPEEGSSHSDIYSRGRLSAQASTNDPNDYIILTADGQSLCQICGQKAKLKQNLIRHIKTVHMKNSTNSYTCKLCGNSFMREDKRKEHMARKHDLHLTTGEIRSFHGEV